MRIEAYFEGFQATIDADPTHQTFKITYDKRSTYEGFVRGEVYFPDGSVLHVREFVDVEMGIDRLTYVYQYMDSEHRLVFRYDNTGHHRKLGLSSYPDHKHVDSEDNVVESTAPDLTAVLDEIRSHVDLTL